MQKRKKISTGVHLFHSKNGSITPIMDGPYNSFFVMDGSPDSGPYFKNGNLVHGPNGKTYHVMDGGSPLTLVKDLNTGDIMQIMDDGADGWRSF